LPARILANHARPKWKTGGSRRLPPSLNSPYLENKFQPELNVTPLGSRLGQRHRDRIGSETDGGRARIDIRRLEIGMVENVKELRSELQAKPLGYHCVLKDRKVKVHQSRPEPAPADPRAQHPRLWV
jgi:hypothetical protein